MISRLVVAIIILIITPSLSIGRDNSVTGGLSLSYDYDDRKNESVRDNPDTPENEALLTNSNDDDYRRIVFSPMVQYVSRSERDSFEVRVAPRINYDLIDYGTEWNNDFYVAADRYITRTWQLRASNLLIRSDYFDPNGILASGPVDPSGEVNQPTDPQLSTDPGRSRYWRNTLDISSDYSYREDSLLRVGFNYIILNNDDTGIGGYEDYDRYVLSLLHEYRFSPRWNTILDMSFVRGDFDPADRELAEGIVGELAPDEEITLSDDQLSKDLNEYHLMFTVENNSFTHDPLSLTYNYIGSIYDELLRDDSDIHQMRLTWRHDFSSRMYSRLGLGPSYEKTEGLDANWGGNGSVELNYLIEHGSFNFLLDKRYDVNNFSGNNEQGFVDTWDTRFSFNYQLLKDLALNSFLSYVYEDRKDPAVALGRVLSSAPPQDVIENQDVAQLAEYSQDRYIAGVGIAYTFYQFYTASIDYTFSKRDSDRIGDDYDDHRLLLTLSWRQELFHW